MTGDLDLAGVGAALNRSYSWAQRNWRRLCEEEGFPRPFVGAANGRNPWWHGPAVERWKAGERAAPCVATVRNETQPIPAAPDAANDARPPVHRAGDRADRLAAAAGG